MPRNFSPSELFSLTFGEYSALSPEDRSAYNRAWLAACIAQTAESEARYLSGDLDRIGGYRRYWDAQ